MIFMKYKIDEKTLAFGAIAIIFVILLYIYSSSMGFVGKFVNPQTADEVVDADNDGLTDLQEIKIGTDPTNKDTDNDGIIDLLDETPAGDPSYKVNVGL